MALILTPEIAEQLRAVPDGQVVVTWDRDGSMSLAPFRSDHDLQMAVAQHIMRNDRAVLAELAKS